MKLIDKTPFRSENGEISLVNRLQAMLKYGLTWPERVKAQDAVAAVLGKQLGGQYVLLQNITLPGTEIELPLVLIGPPGIFLINAVHEKGVFLARDEEWGTLSGESFVPARINQVKRTQAMSKVLLVYLERLGYTNLMVEHVLMSADPKLHIDSTRPAVRIVMSDALDRFALSLAQARMVFAPDMVMELERVITLGKNQPAPQAAPAPAYTPEPSQAAYPASSGDGSLEFSFADETEPQNQLEAAPEAETRREPTPAKPLSSPAKKAPKRKKIMGLTQSQLFVVIVLVLCWLCSLTLFAMYYFYMIGWIRFA